MNQVSEESNILTKAVLWVSVTACLMVVLTTSVWSYGHQITHREHLAANVFTSPGLYYLPDQSTLLLHDHSELTYNYTNDRREIILTGKRTSRSMTTRTALSTSHLVSYFEYSK